MCFIWPLSSPTLVTLCLHFLLQLGHPAVRQPCSHLPTSPELPTKDHEVSLLPPWFMGGWEVRMQKEPWRGEVGLQKGKAPVSFLSPTTGISLRWVLFSLPPWFPWHFSNIPGSSWTCLSGASQNLVITESPPPVSENTGQSGGLALARNILPSYLQESHIPKINCNFFSFLLFFETGVKPCCSGWSSTFWTIAILLL